MKKNQGTIDRVLRIALGLGLLSLLFIGPQTMWGFVGLIPVFTGIIGVCPLYNVLGFDTCSVKRTN